MMRLLSISVIVFFLSASVATYAEPLELADVMPSELSSIGVTPSRWKRTVRQYEAVRSSMRVEHISDADILSMIIGSEFSILEEPYYSEALGALSNQYFSRTYCYGYCVSTYAQLRWLAGIQGFYAGEPEQLIRNGSIFRDSAQRLIQGNYKGRKFKGWTWGGYDYWGYGTSLMGRYIRGETPASWTEYTPYLLADESHRFVILDRAQAYDCQVVDCMGLQMP
mgnify:CR=1 FL=1